MEEEYQKDMEVIFAYEYGYCVFKHNICEDHLEVLEGMPDSAYRLPPEFFVNPGCPLSKRLSRPQCRLISRASTAQCEPAKRVIQRQWADRLFDD